MEILKTGASVTSDARALVGVLPQEFGRRPPPEQLRTDTNLDGTCKAMWGKRGEASYTGGIRPASHYSVEAQRIEARRK